METLDGVGLMPRPNGCLAGPKDPLCVIPEGNICSVCNATSTEFDLMMNVRAVIANGCACDRSCMKADDWKLECGCRMDAVEVIKLVRDHDGTK